MKIVFVLLPLPIFEPLKIVLANIDLREFESIFRSHYPELCGFANKFLSDLDAAEETVQSVFVKMWENRSHLVIDASIRSYLFSAVRNNCLNQIKHMKIRDDYKEYNKRELDQSMTMADDSLEASELDARIQACIDALPAERKKIFLMSRYDGLKYKEIAEKLNISIKTVENQMGSAIKQLRTDLAEYMVLLSMLWWNIFG